MGQTPDQLRRDIEDTRDHLGDTLGAIEDRVSPRAIVDRRRSAMAERWRSMQEAVMGRADDMTSSASETAHGMASNASDAVREAPQMVAERAQGNPWAAGLIAFGAGLLAASLFPATRVEQEQAERVVDGAKPLAEEAKRVAGDVASEVGEQGRGHVEALKEDATQAAEAVRDTARSAADEARDAGRAAAQDVRQAQPGSVQTR